MINQFFEEDLALRRDRDPKLTFGKVSVSSSSSGVFHWLVCSKRARAKERKDNDRREWISGVGINQSIDDFGSDSPQLLKANER